MYMTRSFLPVGQGAFYVERFHNSGGHRDNIVVYDCGSTSKECVERAIKRAFASKRASGNRKVVIDALFISHLHYDHISGIEALLERCEVKRVYLPYTTEENRAVLKIVGVIAGMYKEDSFAARLIENPGATIRTVNDNVEICFVDEYDGETSRDNREDVAERWADKDGYSHITSGVNIASNPDILNLGGMWEYIPYNLKQRDGFEELIRILNATSGKDIVALWQSGGAGRARVKEAYKKIAEGGDLNVNTMTLYSGGSNDCAVAYCNCVCSYDLRCCRSIEWYWEPINGSCLYLGDYNADKHMQELEGAYKKQFVKRIGTIQVPHHGSAASFNIKLIDYGVCFIISAGKNNNYGHPAGEVVSHILHPRRLLHVVSECLSSWFEQAIV